MLKLADKCKICVFLYETCCCVVLCCVVLCCVVCGESAGCVYGTFLVFGYQLREVIVRNLGELFLLFYDFCLIL